VELHLLPAQQLIEKLMGESLLRLISSPLYTKIREIRQGHWDCGRLEEPSEVSPLANICEHWKDRLGRE